LFQIPSHSNLNFLILSFSSQYSLLIETASLPDSIKLNIDTIGERYKIIFRNFPINSLLDSLRNNLSLDLCYETFWSLSFVVLLVFILIALINKLLKCFPQINLILPNLIYFLMAKQRFSHTTLINF
jgi:hypothetical protein